MNVDRTPLTASGTERQITNLGLAFAFCMVVGLGTFRKNAAGSLKH